MPSRTLKEKEDEDYVQNRFTRKKRGLRGWVFSSTKKRTRIYQITSKEAT